MAGELRKIDVDGVDKEVKVDNFKDYSIVHLNDTGKIVATIGYTAQRPVDKNHVKNNNRSDLDPTRRKAVYRFMEEFGFNNLKEMIQFNIAPNRTNKTNKVNRKKEIHNEFSEFGATKIRVLDQADAILIAWGNQVDSHYVRELKNVLAPYEDEDELYWFGPVAVGPVTYNTIKPHGVINTKPQDFRKLDKKNFNKIFE